MWSKVDTGVLVALIVLANLVIWGIAILLMRRRTDE